LWESTDCTGVAYLSVNTSLSGPSNHYIPSSSPAIAVGPPGSTVYVENGPPVLKTFHSNSVGARATSACVDLDPFPLYTVSVPARPLVDMNTLYKPPFTVR